MDLLAALHWRYATKKYSNKKVADEILNSLKTKNDANRNR